MHLIDWAIVFVFLAILTALALQTRRYTRSVADFLAANRCAGRYLLTGSDIMVAFGLTQVIGLFEVFYKAGFTAQWWNTGLCGPIVLLVYMSGWVVYRFRQTRSLTLLQFLEQRYSRRFRLFVGFVSFWAFIAMIGFAPGIEARFIITFCGIGDTISLFGWEAPSFPVVMAAMLGIALFFTFAGGHIAIMVTSFIQGMFCNVVLLSLFLLVLFTFGWSTIIEGLTLAPPKASMINPFQTSETENYDVWFFLIWGFNYIFIWPCFQASQGYNSAAKNPHEMRMARVLGNVRGVAIYSAVLMLPLVAYVVMHHPQYADLAAATQARLEQIDSEYLRYQMTVPTVLTQILPIGLFGAFVAAMLAAMISTQDTFMHAGGSVLIQDVIVPFLKKPLSRRAHMWLLRGATVAVAIMVFLFSLYYQQKQDIMLLVAIMGSFYYSGAAAAVIFGLYWKHGTTAGAWAAVFTGLGLTGLAFYFQRVDPAVIQRVADWVGMRELDSQRLSFFIAIAAMFAYVIVSLLTRGAPHDMDKLLHRGAYAIDEPDQKEPAYQSFWQKVRSLGITDQFTRGDKIAYFAIAANATVTILAFVVVSVLNLLHPYGPGFWSTLWKIYLWQTSIVAGVVTIWFLIGGSIDLKDLYRRLKTVERNDADDGSMTDATDAS